jgi:hypothetical protein
MIIFARKHYTAKNARLFAFFINIAIYFRAFLSILSRVLKNILLPSADTVLLFGGTTLFARFWEQHIIYPWGGHYPNQLYFLLIPLFVTTWITNIYFSGGYDKPMSLWRSYRGLASGTLLILVIYALLPENLRFSRSLIFTSTAWGILSLTLSRFFMHALQIPGYKLNATRSKRFAVVGEIPEAQRVANLLQKALSNPGFIGLINSSKQSNLPSEYLGNILQIKDIINIYQIDELIFCAKDMPAESIIDQMSALQHTQVEYKIAPPESMSIIGSNSIDTAGDLYIIDINSIGKFQNRRNKRVFDVGISIALLISYPVSVFITGHPLSFLLNILKVLFGLRSITGYHPAPQGDHKLPEIRKGILYPTDGIGMQNPDPQLVSRLNLLYARGYSVSNDFRLLYKGFRHLGRK